MSYIQDRGLVWRLFCFFLFVLWVFTAGSLWSFYPEDSSLYSSSFPQSVILNFFGPLGAHFAGVLFFYFGAGAFWFFLIFGVLFFQAFISGFKGFYLKCWSWFWCLFGWLCICHKFPQTDFYSKNSYPLSAGGYLSSMVHERLSPYIGDVGLMVSGWLFILLAMILFIPVRQDLTLDLKS